MISYTIKFTDFSTKESFCKLQRYFLGLDYKGRYVEIDEEYSHQIRTMSLVEPLDNPEVIIYFPDKEDYSVLKFEEDFVNPKILKMSTLAFQSFKKGIEDKGLYTDELLSGYAKDFLDKLIHSRRQVERATYLKDKVREKLFSQYEQLEELIQEFVKDPFIEVKEKLQFNWRRTDIIYFFHLLRKNKVIAYMSDGDLGRIIDTVCQYKNPDTGGYLEIKRSRKHLNDFHNDQGRPENPAADRIKEVFGNEDFYNS